MPKLTPVDDRDPTDHGCVVPHDRHLTISLNDTKSSSALYIRLCLEAKYFEPFIFTKNDLAITFTLPPPPVLDAMQRYKSECESVNGYQSPVFARGAPLPLNDETGYDTDDDRRERHTCSIM
jgi:hypothetical protein